MSVAMWPVLHSSKEPEELSQWLCHDSKHHKYCQVYYYYYYCHNPQQKYIFTLQRLY